jgi:hypothetical protein
MSHTNPSFSPEELQRANPYVVSFLKLRRMVGYIALAIAPVLFVITLLGGNCKLVQDSISHYYYTIAGDVFVGMLCATAFFLVVYPGYTKNDNLLTTAAGFFSFCVAFFPTWPMRDRTCSVVTLPMADWVGLVHGIAATLFFGILAYIAIWVFTKSKDAPGKRPPGKVRRNRLFRTCGVIIAVCIVIIGASFFFPSLMPYYTQYNLVYWFEFLALVAFGVCWLVKGEALKSVAMVREMLY